MNRLIYSLLLLSCAASTLVSCTDDPTQDLQLSTSEGKTWVTLDFGDNSFEEINITTRTTLNGAAEGRVSNFFVLLFDADGKRVYGRLFDRSNRKDSKIELIDSKEECWWVEGNSLAERTHGKVRMYAPAITNGGTLYIFANVSADMVNVSPEKLRFIETLGDLKAMTATLNQKITERNGFFPMTGSASGIEIGGGQIASSVKDSFPVKLTRLDAKIEVKVRVAAGYESSTTDETTGVTTTHTIKEFVPLSWQVVNLPRSASVLPPSEAEVDPTATREFFTTREIKFETREHEAFSYDADNDPETDAKKSDVHGFSFYMLENRLNPKYKKEITGSNGYHLRDKRRKNDDGTYNTKDGLWEYAPEEATYLIIKGEVLMDLTPGEEMAQQLSANVVYYIHLGDFANNLNDYNVERNTSYTYTITIYGVDNIQAEVEKETEEQSGATGHVYVAKESIYTFDAHFGRTLAFFDEAYLNDVDDLTWYVSTPFGREGKPHLINGVEVPAGLDYQWVHFMINQHDENEYNTKREEYDPENTKDILEFSKYIKAQKVKFQEDKKDGHIDNESDFRREFDQDWYDKYGKPAGKNKEDDGVWYRYRIYVTIFVDEFYYTADPVTGDVRQDLWKDFVNQPNRMMHILCNSDVSQDEASRLTGSVVTIRQRSIQTIFNTEKPELKTAWGCETIDETRDALWFYSRNESYNSDGNWVKPSDAKVEYEGNWSDFNGLFNTVRIWGLMLRNSGGAGVDVFNTDPESKKKWNDYIDYNEEPYNLKKEDLTETLRYSCMTRNRDENGNGKIDAAEVKWYMAAINQLAALYVGDQGLNSDAALYPYYKQIIKENKMDANNAYTWRSHIVSSTAFDYGYGSRHGDPTILWAEEGLSTSQYSNSFHKSAGLSVRCVRNLGMDPTSEVDAQKMLEDETAIPEKAIRVTGPGLNDNTETATPESIYTFNMTNMNPLSIRYYTSRELEPNDEFSMEARVYWGFETGPMTDETYTYDELYNLLMEGKSPCPVGYRVPNIREAALMTLNCPLAWQPAKTYGRVSTYYSHGTAQGKPYGGIGLDKAPTWLFDADRTRLEDEGTSAKIRCVRDIRQR